MSERTARHLRRHELTSRDEIAQMLALEGTLRGCTIQGVPLGDASFLRDVEVDGAIFLGCETSGRDVLVDLVSRGAAVFPTLGDLPWNPYRNTLYSVDELLEGWDDGGFTTTRDFRIYAWYDRERRHADGVGIRADLAWRLHDHAIDDALYDWLSLERSLRTVGVMGGHAAARTDHAFRQAARVGWRLTRAGYLIATGGGPGVMEAANLGAWLSCFADPDIIDAAIERLSIHPTYSAGLGEGDPGFVDAVEAWVNVARDVRDWAAGDDVARTFARDAAEPGESLAVPTWFYGHEPTNLFATHVAKYFANSLREDGLLALARGGVVYAEGSAGTWQEVFMDLAQNHYATFDYRSPMLLLGDGLRDVEVALRRFVETRDTHGRIADMIARVEDDEQALAFLQAHPPRLAERGTPLWQRIEEEGR